MRFLVLLLTAICVLNSHQALCCYTAIFGFGDSLTDTGNEFQLYCKIKPEHNPCRPPYGETFFGHPTGRSSDGRVIIDFFAQAFQLPLVRPFLAGGGREDFLNGANFAVGGATALGRNFFKHRGFKTTGTWVPYPLGVQIRRFKTLLPTLCSTDSECQSIMSNSLFLVGEIGGNDYHIGIFNRRRISEVRTYVPYVINATSSAIQHLIKLGAKTLVVPGYLPVGCISRFLSEFQSKNREDYDQQTGCLKLFNKFGEYHNSLLQAKLDQLRKRHPSITLIYADYFEATMDIFRSPRRFGINRAPLDLVACCGGGGPYNFNSSHLCGDGVPKLCADPSRYANWDTQHLTEAAYRVIAHSILSGAHATVPLSKGCRLANENSTLPPH